MSVAKLNDGSVFNNVGVDGCGWGSVGWVGLSVQ